MAESIPSKYHDNKTYTSAKVDPVGASFGLTELKPASIEEVTWIINNLDPNTSSGIDNINTKSIKCLKRYIVLELTNCINYCLEQGIFPTQLKIAKVKPIFKTGTRSDPNNYRPISVLPVISKIFEKVLYNRLDPYLDSISFLYPKQYGFRQRSNTLSASVDLITKVKNSIDEGKVCLGIFIDLKKAFDTVSHAILLNKLQETGITDMAYNIFESYLTNRSQVVMIEEFSSSTAHVTYGVPQGSVLGPLLFLIYINNISKLQLKGELSLFADDTTLFYFGHKIEMITQEAQKDLDLLNVWFQCNLLTLNVAKTHYVIFTAKNKKISNFPPLTINNVAINKSDNAKYLGLTLDSRLTWIAHINKIKSKLKSLTGALRGVVRCLPLNIRYTIYNSMVKPHIDYLVEIWGSASKTNLKPLQTAQNKLIKTLFQYDYLTPSSTLYEKTKLMDINKTYIYYSCILVRKILKKEIHTNITFNPKNINPQKSRLRNANNIILRPPRTNYGKHNITYESAQTYNKLPSNIKDATNLLTFKKLLKLYLLNEYHH